MKKFFFTLALLCAVAGAGFAQTVSEGTIILNPQLTNLAYNSFKVSSDGASSKFSMYGLQADGGYAIKDDLLIIGGVGYQGLKFEDTSGSMLNIRAGVRYYIFNGLFASGSLVLGHGKLGDGTFGDLGFGDEGYEEEYVESDAKADLNSLNLAIGVGYSIFLAERFSIDPFLNYTYGLSNKVAGESFGMTALSLNIGFSFYF